MRRTSSTWKSRVAPGVVASALALALAAGVAGPAHAQSQTGWVGGTAPTGGVVYLHSSTITDSPALRASSVVYSSFGQMVPSFRMGVQARLFKSGVLCKINPYVYNPTSVSRLEDGTAGDCGSGSYNSHGFVQVTDGGDWVPYVTFPTNPINYTAPANRTVYKAATSDVEGRNSRGQTFGSAAQAKDANEIPDLVLSYGTSGQLGYVRAADLAGVGSGTRTLTLFKSDGVTQIGQFEVGK